MAKYELPEDLAALWDEGLPSKASEAWEKLSDDERKKALSDATSFMEQLPWRGKKTSAMQNLTWPRTGVILDDGTLLPSNIIPKEIKDCTAMVATFIAANIPVGIPAMAHVFCFVNGLLIPGNDIKNNAIRPWNSTIH